jgi:hypothetical protein
VEARPREKKILIQEIHLEAQSLESLESLDLF